MVLVAVTFLSACQTKNGGQQTTTPKINTNNTNQQVNTPSSVTNNNNAKQNITNTNTNTNTNQQIDVTQHNKASDCWMIVDGLTYNVTDYIKSGMHPGGNNILKGCGKDATIMFDNKHKSETKAMLADYLVK